MVEQASEKVPVFRSANMSVGINVLIELARRATKLFDGEFDIEIVEKHHHNKLDAPQRHRFDDRKCHQRGSWRQI